MVGKYSFSRPLRRLFSVISILIMLAACFMTIPETANASTFTSNDSQTINLTPPVLNRTVSSGVKRIYGANRYKTSMEISKTILKELPIAKCDTVIVASGTSFPDALSASYLASKTSAQILIMPQSGSKEVMDYIKSVLIPDGKIYIMGGTSALNSSVEASLNKIGSVTRLSGSNRYLTNAEAIKEAAPEGEELIVCSGKNYPDALSAAAAGRPIMLVGDTLNTEQKQILKQYFSSGKKIYVIGGTGAVSSKIENQLKSYAPKVTRLAGKDRYETSIKIAGTFFKNAKEAVIASGDNFPDSLSGGVLAFNRGVPLLLSSNSPGFQTAYDYIRTKGIRSVTILGGKSVVANEATGLTSSGKYQTGFFTVGGRKYYAKSDYTIEKNKLFKVSGKSYYALSNGVIITNNTITTGGNTYVAASDGSLTKANKIIYLTFDDGPGPYTAKLLDILDKFNAKATFFVCPQRSTYRYLIGRASSRGHAIGNHTYSHNYSYIYSSESRFWADFEKAQKIIKQQTGSPTKLLRFPGGSSNHVSMKYSSGIMRRLAKQCSQKGYAYFDWNVDSRDAGGTTTSSGVYQNIVNGVSGKKVAVVLCHDVKGYTVNAIEDVLKWGRKNGYVFLPLTTSSPTAHHTIAN